MHPILLTIGPLEFRSHDVMVVLGAILSFVLFIRVTRKTAITPRDILSGIAIIFPITYLLSNVISLAIFNSPAQFAFTAQGFLIWLGVVALLSVLASILPARNASRLTIREVLAYE